LSRKNLTGPENVTAFPSARDHFAPEDVAAPQTFDLGSVFMKGRKSSIGRFGTFAVDVVAGKMTRVQWEC
jgi:hypothetical protein